MMLGFDHVQKKEFVHRQNLLTAPFRCHGSGAKSH
jgi:hypothetical protein